MALVRLVSPLKMTWQYGSCLPMCRLFGRFLCDAEGRRACQRIVRGRGRGTTHTAFRMTAMSVPMWRLLDICAALEGSDDADKRRAC